MELENYWTDEFKEFYDELTDFAKQLVVLISVENHECPENYFKIVLNNCKKYDKSIVERNYISNKTTETIELKYFDNDEKEYLKDRLLRLDGTLLCDIVRRSLRNHKIFLN